MRFITEFELLTDFEIKKYKELRQWGTAQALGTDIAKAFGWKERGETTTHGSVAERHTLEIEAFPMDKWVEFKKSLLEILETPPGDDHARNAFELISKLESFSKKENNEK